MDKKTTVIQVARDLFTKYGYKKVTMDEIAKSSGVTKKTIYTYFKDKDSMFQYFVEEELDNMRQNVENIEKQNLPFIDFVSVSLYEMLKYRTKSLLITTISQEVKRNGTSQCIEFLKLYDAGIIHYIEEKIQKEIANHNIKNCDVHLTAFIIYKIYLAVMFEYDGEIDEERITKEVTSILKDGLFN